MSSLIHKIKSRFSQFDLKGVKKPLHIAISQGFVAVLFILVDFIFSKRLSVAEFGLWKELFFFFNLGIPLLAFGLPEGYKYFIAKDTNLAYYFKNILSLLIAIGLLLFGVLLIANLLHWLEVIDMKQYYGYSLLFPLPLFSFLINKVLRYSYINLDLAHRLTKLSFFGMLISLLAVSVAAFFIGEHRTMIVMIAVIIYSLIFLMPSLFYLRALPALSLKFGLDKEAIRSMLTYGLPLYLATFAGLFSGYLDKLIVNVYEDEATFAIFAVGAFEIPLFAMLSAAFSQQIFPKMVRSIEDDQEDAAKSLWISTTRKVSMITYPIILLAMFFAQEIIFFVYSDAYVDSIILFKTYLLVALFRNNSYGILLTAKGNTTLITKISVFVLLINSVLSVLLFYYFGLRGVVFGTLISTFLFTTYVLIKEGMVMRHIKKVLFKIEIAALISLILIVYFLF